jgi:very-short-patch-repair endonuclease
MITREQIGILEKKLISENRSSNYLNACNTKDGKSKVDFFTVHNILGKDEQRIQNNLFTENGSISIEPNSNSIEELVSYSRLLENLTGIIQKQTQIFRNKGIESLKLGYPMISYQTRVSQSDCFLAPIFLIDIKITANSRKIEILNTNGITINPNLIIAIQNYNIPIHFNETLIGIRENLNVPELFSHFLKENSNHITNKTSTDFERIPFAGKAQLHATASSVPTLNIHNSGIISNFIGSNIGIINDLKAYQSGIEDVAPFDFKIRPYPKQNLDPSQLNVIESFNKNKHLIIHGPPGTGKSQTITGIITSALAEKKTVLVVCEKRAALDVIHANLAKENFDAYIRTLTNIDRDQNRIIREIRDVGENIRTNNRNLNDNRNNNNQTENILAQRAKELVQSKSILSWDILPNQKWKDLVGRKISSEDYSYISVPVEKIENWIQNYDATIDDCNKASKLKSSIINHELLKKYVDFEYGSNDILENINSIKKLIEKENILIQEKAQVEINIPYILHKELDHLNEKYTTNKNRLAQIKTEAERISKFFKESFYGTAIYHDIQFENIQISIDKLEKFETKLSDEANNVFELPADIFNTTKTNLFKYITDNKYRNNLNKYKKIKKFIGKPSREEIINAITKNIENSQETSGLLKDLQSKCGNNYESHCTKLNKAIFEDQITITKINSLKNSNENISIEIISKTINSEEVNKIKNILIELEEIQTLITNNQLLSQNFRKIYQTNPNQFKIELINLQELSNEIINYCEYRSINLKVFNNSDLHPSIDPLRLFYNKISQFKLNEFYQIHNTLTTNKEDLINTIETNKINEQKKSQSLAMHFLLESFKAGMSNAAKFSSIFALRGRNRKSLREICNSHLDVFVNCCPVLLTTPDVVSTLFSGKSNVYDLIIFDEASQIEIHNSLGAFQKGKAKIIAGDQHQMPPSSYFRSSSNDENFDQDEVPNENNEVEQQAFLDVESLLDFCISNQNDLFESKYLDFHYRSEHPALIRFSNEAIYKRLVVKPTADINFKPFEFVHQANGIWENGENYKEATTVIDVINKIKLTPEQTPLVLVGTLNINQANLISKLITSKRSSDTEFEKKFTKLESAGFAVVNLENMQGDECDIMILSTGYGPNREGVFRSQFIFRGAKGYRLLNVAVTRARYKNILVTSIPKTVYVDYLPYLSNEEINPKTRGLFYAYINYVEAYSKNNIEQVNAICENIRKYFLTGIDTPTFKEEDFESPFEEEVYSVLLTKFESSEITLQENHGESGFRIDMVIRPKECPKLKIAIECDGATYHHGWSNQILDGHRQTLLEKANYKFVRIWSTDWWQNPKGAQSAMFSKIDAILDNYLQDENEKISWLNDLISHPEVYQNNEVEFTDEIIFSDDDYSDNDSFTTQSTVIEKRISRTCSVRLNINGTQEKFVRISDYKQNTADIMDADSPLAKLLFGKKEGDVVIFNNFHYMVLEIIS